MRPLFLLLLLLNAPLAAFENITALYLSWYKDPTTTMTIQWHSDLEEDAVHCEGPDGQTATHNGAHHLFPGEEIFIHTVTLEGLEPDTEYRFQINEEVDSYTFRTAPTQLSAPLRFVIGGDLYRSPKLFRKMGKTVVAQGPLFAVLGGDLAYAIDRARNLFSSPSRRWRQFLADWKETLVAANNRLIPMLIVSGNHDLAPDDYELFFSLFAFPKKELYRAVDFGSYLSLILLDTGHFQPIEGRQTVWLEKALASRKSIPYLFAIYHEGAYPSFYSFQAPNPKKIRANWCPLFDKYGLQAAFEHHSHTYKKTFPMKAGSIDPNGTFYFGDGCWGVPPRKPSENWYLEKRARKNNVYLVELSSDSASIQAIALNGETLDTTTIQSQRPLVHP